MFLPYQKLRTGIKTRVISKGATVLYCYSNHLYLKQYLTLFILSLSSMVSKQQEGKASIMKVMMSKRAKSHMFSTKTSIASWLIGKLWYANNLRRTEVTKKLWNWWLSVHCSQCGCGNHQKILWNWVEEIFQLVRELWSCSK